MTMITWAAMAVLQTTHCDLDAFDMDLSGVPEASRQAVMMRELSKYYQPGDPCQVFAATLGFAIDAEGVATSDERSPDRGYTLAVLLEDESCESDGGPGPLAAAIGYGSSKQAEKDASVLAQLAELVAIALGMSDRRMPEPSPADMEAMRIRILAHRPVLAA